MSAAQNDLRDEAGGHGNQRKVAPAVAVTHPLVDPGPSVGREEVRGLLVGQQRRDPGMVERAQRLRPGVRHLQPHPAQGNQQLGPGVRVETGRGEGLAHLGCQSLELLRPRPPRRALS